jgi:hypothetical protein
VLLAGGTCCHRSISSGHEHLLARPPRSARTLSRDDCKQLTTAATAVASRIYLSTDRSEGEVDRASIFPQPLRSVCLFCHFRSFGQLLLRPVRAQMLQLCLDALHTVGSIRHGCAICELHLSFCCSALVLVGTCAQHCIISSLSAASAHTCTQQSSAGCRWAPSIMASRAPALLLVALVIAGASTASATCLSRRHLSQCAHLAPGMLCYHPAALLVYIQ